LYFDGFYFCFDFCQILFKFWTIGSTTMYCWRSFHLKIMFKIKINPAMLINKTNNIPLALAAEAADESASFSDAAFSASMANKWPNQSTLYHQGAVWLSFVTLILPLAIICTILSAVDRRSICAPHQGILHLSMERAETMKTTICPIMCWA